MEEKEKTPEKNLKNTNILVLIIFALLLVIACMATYIITDKNNNTSNNNSPESKRKTETKTEKEKEEEKIEYANTNDYKYETKVYTDGMSYSFKKESWNEYAYTIKTETENVEDLTRKDGLLLYNDKTLKVLEEKTEKIIDLGITREYDDYNMNLDKNRKKVVGLVGSNRSSRGRISATSYINITTGKKLYENTKDELSIINEDYIYKSEETGKDENDNPVYAIHILKTNEEKEVKTINNFGVCEIIMESTNNSNIYTVSQSCVGVGDYRFMNSNFEYFTDKLSNSQYYFGKKNGNLYVLENNKVVEYNENGKAISTVKLSGKVLHIFEDIYLTEENKNIYLKDYKDFSEKFSKVPADEYYYHSPISGYYPANTLSNDKEKKAGYYFIFEKKTEETFYAEGSEPGVEYYFDPKTKQIDSWELKEVGGYAKPVLYLYPEKETKVTINFEHEENLTTTYPKFKDNWVVKAHPNGDLYDENGKYYYGLYWEEEKNHDVSFNEGFYVTKDNAIDFLEEKLTILGLNPKERNEFIMYWLPILEKNSQSLVYFEQTVERDSYNKLLISPQPDSVLRLAIHVKKVNNKVNIKEQKLNTFTRKGFTVVEWGGVIH